MPRPLLATLAGLSLALGGAFLAACGSDDKEGSDSAAQTQTAASPEASPSGDTGGTKAEATTVDMKSSKFVPEKVSVAVGQMITWTNSDGYAHNVTSTSGEKIESGDIEGKAKFEFTPKQVGTIAYTCTLHANQNGTIDVTK